MKIYFPVTFLFLVSQIMVVQGGEKELIDDIVKALKPLVEVKKGDSETQEEVEKREQLEDDYLKKFMDVVVEKTKLTGEGALTLANVQKVLDGLTPLLAKESRTSRFLGLRSWLRDRVQLINIKTNKHIKIPKTVKEKIEFFNNYFSGKDKDVLADLRLSLENPVLTAFCVGFALLAHRPDALYVIGKDTGPLSWADVPPEHITRSLVRPVGAIDKEKVSNKDKDYLWKHVFDPFFFSYGDELSQPRQVGGAGGLKASILKDFSKDIEQLQTKGLISQDTAKTIAEKTIETMVENANKQVGVKVGKNNIVSFETAMDEAVDVFVDVQKKDREERQKLKLVKKQQEEHLLSLTKSLRALL